MCVCQHRRPHTQQGVLQAAYCMAYCRFLFYFCTLGEEMEKRRGGSELAGFESYADVGSTGEKTAFVFAITVTLGLIAGQRPLYNLSAFCKACSIHLLPSGAWTDRGGTFHICVQPCHGCSDRCRGPRGTWLFFLPGVSRRWN